MLLSYLDNQCCFSAFLPTDWLVIILTILAVLAILLVCVAVAKRKRCGPLSKPRHPLRTAYIMI